MSVIFSYSDGDRDLFVQTLPTDDRAKVSIDWIDGEHNRSEGVTLHTDRRVEMAKALLAGTNCEVRAKSLIDEEQRIMCAVELLRGINRFKISVALDGAMI